MNAPQINVFEYLNYRRFLLARLKQGPRGEQAKLAKNIRCQPTYLSQILRGTVNITEDQAFRAGRHFGLTDEELDYFLDLVRMDRTGDEEAKKYFLTLVLKKTRKVLPPDTLAALDFV